MGAKAARRMKPQFLYFFVSDSPESLSMSHAAILSFYSSPGASSTSFLLTQPLSSLKPEEN